MTKSDKRMGVPAASTRRREPVVEPHKTPGKPSKSRRRPYVLVERIPLSFSRSGEWVFRHRYATAEARTQARKKFERAGWRKDRTTFEEIDE